MKAFLCKEFGPVDSHQVEEIDDPLEVHDFFTVVNPEEQLFENEWPTIEESLKRKVQPAKSTADETMEIEAQ